MIEKIKQVIAVPNLKVVFWMINHKNEGGKFVPIPNSEEIVTDDAVLALVEEYDKDLKKTYTSIVPYSWCDGEFLPCVDDSDFVDLSFEKVVDKARYIKMALAKNRRKGALDKSKKIAAILRKKAWKISPILKDRHKQVFNNRQDARKHMHEGESIYEVR